MKGFFTQSAVVLAERAFDLGELERALDGLTIARRIEAEGARSWMGGTPTLLLPFRPEVNGHVAVDIVDALWPDAMGDPKAEAELFGAWTLGWFGPFAYPGNLERAVAQAHGWPDAARVVARHRSFVRIKSSYVFGASPSAPVLPPEYDALAELRFVTEVARRILGVTGSLCYFDPNGESLQPATTVDEQLAHDAGHGLPPLPLWANARLFNLEDADGWLMVDTIGMRQLDVVDHEACFNGDRFDIGEVVSFLRNATYYVQQNGPVIKDGDTMDGPGGVRWRGMHFDESIAPAPRPVLRWIPLDGAEPPARLR